jgi:hypothetical protein
MWKEHENKEKKHEVKYYKIPAKCKMIFLGVFIDSWSWH